MTWPATSCSARQMFTISPGNSASVGIGSIGAGSTSRPLVVTRRERLHELHVAVLRGRGRVEHGVLRREPEHHRDVAELEVAVDEHHRVGGSLRHRDRDVDRDAGLADPTLGREDDDQSSRLSGTGRRRRSGRSVSRSRRASRPRGRPTGGGSPRRRSPLRRAHRRAAPAGARRSTARSPRTPRRPPGARP